MPKNSTTTPLLAGDEEPALSNGIRLNDTPAEEESALSRLIAESTPPEALMPFSPASDHDGIIVDETSTAATNSANNNNNSQHHKPASLATALAGTLLCLQWGFIWGAFFSNAWMDSHLQISLGWQTRFLPWLDGHTDVVIQSSSVFSLASNLKDDKDYGSLVGLWICSVILPCVFMIVCPIWILTDYTVPSWGYIHSNNNARRARQERQESRLWLELSIRLSLLVAFIILILDVAITGIGLSWEDTDLQVHNELKGPYIAYLLGCTCALLAVVILRMPYMENLRLLRYPTTSRQRQQHQIRSAASYEEIPITPATRAPPANAFRLGWLTSSSSTPTRDGEDNAETEALLASNNNSVEASPTTRLPIPATSPPPPTTSTMAGWKKWVVFNSGLLSLVLWIPALTLVQFRVLYGGMVMELVTTPAFSVYLWQLPGIIWQSGVQSGTPLWILLLTFCVIGTLVLVLPLLAHLIGVIVWLLPYGCKGNSVRVLRLRAKLRDVLQLIHPLLCGIPFSVAIFVTVPSFIDIGENLDDAVCTSIENVVQNQCLISGGVRLAGCWFLVAQSIALEAFVFLTIRWTAPKPIRGIVV